MSKVLLFLYSTILLVTPVEAKEALCLAETIYYEARGEPRYGKLLVAEVVLNRVNDPRFPDTICGVISQKGQFPWYSKKRTRKEQESWSKAKNLANRVLNEELSLPNTGSLYFNSGKQRLGKKTIQYGNHTFYRN